MSPSPYKYPLLSLVNTIDLEIVKNGVPKGIDLTLKWNQTRNESGGVLSESVFSMVDREITGFMVSPEGSQRLKQSMNFPGQHL